jgi:hypothetical protein
MFIHFYTHDILIFVLNYDKNSLNINVPYVICPSLNAFNWIFSPNPFLQFDWISNNNTYPQKIQQYCSHFRFQNYKINFIKLKLVRVFQQYQEHPQYSFQSWFFKKINKKMVQ